MMYCRRCLNAYIKELESGRKWLEIKRVEVGQEKM